MEKKIDNMALSQNCVQTIIDMESNMNTFTITCYGKTKTYKESQRNKMTHEFKVAMLICDGSEAERYENIYQDLIAGEKECMDTERPLTPEMEEMLAKMFAKKNTKDNYISQYRYGRSI